VSTTTDVQPATVQPPAVFTVLDDGTVLYRTYQDAQAARLQQAGDQKSQTLKNPAQVKLGEQYLAKDGNAAPYSLGGLVEFQLTGLIVVLVALISLSLICAAIGRLLNRLQTLQASTARVATAVPAENHAAASIHPGLSDQQLLVLLTAAASEVLEEPVRVERFRPLNARDLTWAAQGRHALQDHRLK